MTDTEAQLLLQLVQAQGREIAALLERMSDLEERVVAEVPDIEGFDLTHL